MRIFPNALFRRLLFRWSTHRSSLLSLRGFVFLFATTLLGLAAVDAGINLLLLVFGLCLAACLLSAFTGWYVLRRVSITRSLPEAITAATPFEIRYTLTNRTRWGTARNLHLVDRPESVDLMTPIETYVSVLRPGETLLLTTLSAARTRGRVRLRDIRITSSFPFGIFVKSVFRRQVQELIVFPRLGRLLGEIKSSLRYSDVSQSGMAPAVVKGDEEYYGIREYRIGDNPRRIHWRRSARTGQLMVREMTKVRDRKFWCVLNTRVNPRNAADSQKLELAISAVATAVCDALERGAKVGLICNGEPLVVLPPGGGRAHRPRLLRELATRIRNVDDALATHIQGYAWPNAWRGACLLFAANDDEDLRDAVRALNIALGPTTVLVPGQPAFDNLFFIPPSDGPPTRRLLKVSA